MKRTGIFDFNGFEIVEGDKISLSLTENDKNHDYYKFINLDSIIVEVLDSDGCVGVSVALRLYSDGVEVGHTFQSELDYYLKESDQDEDSQLSVRNTFIADIKKRGHELSDLRPAQIISSVTDSISFYHTFIHKKKEIISKGVIGTERKRLLGEKNPERLLKLENGQIFDPKDDLIIALSDEAKSFIEERIALLYEETIFEGDFTHLKGTCKEFGDFNHKIIFEGCNSDGLVDFFEYRHNEDKYKAAMAGIREIFETRTKELVASGISEKEARKQSYPLAQEGRKLLKSDKNVMDKTPVSDIFISLTSSIDVLNVLNRKGSSICVFDDKVKNKNKNSITKNMP